MTRRPTNFPQLFYPGMPQLTERWMGDYQIVWSIYIRCSNRPKLQRVHIPALEEIIGQPHGGRGWVIEAEPDTPGEIRLMTIEPLPGPYSDAMLLSFFRRLYALRPTWTVMARLDETHPHGVYVYAHNETKNTGRAVPAVSNALIELEPNFSTIVEGRTSNRSATGANFSADEE